MLYHCGLASPSTMVEHLPLSSPLSLLPSHPTLANVQHLTRAVTPARRRLYLRVNMLLRTPKPPRLTGRVRALHRVHCPAGQPRVSKRAEHLCGQSVVELALLLPLLIVLLAITFDVGRGMAAYMTVIHAAREGAWIASKQPWDTSGIEEAVRSALREGGLDPTRAAIAIDTGPPGAPVEVRVTYAYDPMLPLPVGDITLRAQHRMVRLY